MQVVTELAQRGAFLDQQTLVAALKQVPAFAAQPVETVGKCRLQPLHPGDQVSLGGFEREVVVVAHHDKSVEEPAGFFASLEQAGLECHSRLLGSEDVGAIVPAVEHVITRSGKLQSQFTRHSMKLGDGLAQKQYEILKPDPFC